MVAGQRVMAIGPDAAIALFRRNYERLSIQPIAPHGFVRLVIR